LDFSGFFSVEKA